MEKKNRMNNLKLVVFKFKKKIMNFNFDFEKQRNPKDEFMRINKLQKKEKTNKTVDNRTDPDLILKYYRSGSSRNSEHMATWNVN